MTEGTVLVIGATGFIGKAVVSRLSALGLSVVGTGRSQSAIGCDLELEIGDDSAIDKCSVLGDIDVVVNCAGLAHQFNEVPAAEFVRVNTDGSSNGMRIAIQSNARRYVMVSSVAVYGDHGNALVDETFECKASGDYAISKHLGELRVAELTSESGPDVVVIRPSTVIGAGDRGNTARLAESIAKGRFVWIGKGDNFKSLVACEDVAEAVARTVVATGKVGGTYNISAPPITMREIVGSLADEIGKKIPRVSVPRGLVEFVIAANRRTAAVTAFESIGSTVEKFLSNDRFSARRFDAKFGPMIYRPIPGILREMVRATIATKP